jgi:MinD-like ATPase involved in chromosome partitioning or flagellar assembly
MALANIAILLAQRGHRVLVVDWDLEAPGIEKYFSDLQLAQSGLGLLSLLSDVASGGDPNYVDFTWKASALDGAFEFSFLHSGREADPEYFQHLEQFSWRTFFDRGGGNYLETLRERWLEHFEFVLVDSRTGLSDAGGVCTIQLPDIIVALFTPARQSLFGVRDVMRLAQSARHRLAFDRAALSVIPVPSRVAREQQSFTQWMDIFTTELNEFFAEWLPKESDRRHVLERLTLDHAPGVAHGERIAAFQQDDDCAALVSTYERLTTLLESNLGDVSPLIATQTTVRPTGKVKAPVGKGSKVLERYRTRPTLEYEHDLYFSYARSQLTTEWVYKHLLPLIQAHLELELGEKANVFFDRAEITAGQEWVGVQRRALLQSRLLLAIWSRPYFASRWCLAEFRTFLRRSELVNKNLIVPLTIHDGDSFPPEAQVFQWADFREFMIVGEAFTKSERYLGFDDAVRNLCRVIAPLLKSVPPLNPKWPVIEPKDEITTSPAIGVPRI